MADKGKIIFLNGVSSSGKTTLSKVLQAKLHEPFFRLAMDTFIDMSPLQFWNIDFNAMYNKTSSALHYAIKMFSDMGISKIYMTLPLILSLIQRINVPMILLMY